jgi:hypothetical protein
MMKDDHGPYKRQVAYVGKSSSFATKQTVYHLKMKYSLSTCGNNSNHQLFN